MRQVAPVAVSIIVMLSFGLALGMVLTHAVPEGSEKVADIMLGSLGTMAANVVGYWVGSSAGSAQKTDLLYRSAPAVAPQGAAREPAV